MSLAIFSKANERKLKYRSPIVGFLNRTDIIILLCGFILTAASPSQAREEGDPCVIKTMPGICRASSICDPHIDNYIKSGKLTIKDVPSCGFNAREEIVCCPVAPCCDDDDDGNSGQSADDMLARRLSTTTRRTTTTTTTTMRPTTRTSSRPSTLDDQSAFFDFQQLLAADPSRITESVPRKINHMPSQTHQSQQMPNNKPTPVPIRQPLPDLGPNIIEPNSFDARQAPPSTQLGFQSVGAWGEASQERRSRIINRPLQRWPSWSQNEQPVRVMPQQQPRPSNWFNPNAQRQWQSQQQQQQQQPSAHRFNPQVEVFDPIQLVNERLRQRGMDIVEAKPVAEFEFSSQRQQPTASGFFEPVRTTTSTATSTTASPTVHSIEDYLAPFRFQAKPVDDLNGNELGNGDAFEQSATRTPPVNPVTPTRMTDPRAGNERPALEACRKIYNREGVHHLLTPHILDGIPVEPGMYPHMAAIGYTLFDNVQFRCGGSLISDRFVLTAAHCVYNPKEVPSFVRLGTVDVYNLTDSFQDINILPDKIRVHPDYMSSSKYHDIALLELAQAAQFTDFVYPACLETNMADPPSSSTLYVSGWGTTNQTTRAQSKFLLRAPLQIVNIKECNESYAALPTLQKHLDSGIQLTQLCAADKKRQKADACQGDSGGPLVIERDLTEGQYSLLGIISAGFGCNTNTPGLYTRVAAYLTFIEQIVWPDAK